ncbi:protein dachsous-like [Ctenocephalides felis]|uniref:protein dachsous-like n=1 Tax=Ctenocephalides felis TaxID=7515 RepID=UPI000E6E2667|nr:protein dachsous-like [Ctenocephalides felis]
MDLKYLIHKCSWMQLLFVWIFFVFRVSADSRCFLEGGGSAESFFVSEDLPVGSIIGSLSILGDPRIIGGDITLGLRERDSPVQIAAGSRDLVLRAPLDKEGRQGPSSVYVNVICDRRLSGDPSFVIPVNIRVTDANDNAPQWIGAPYTLTLSEVTVPGTRVLQGARAVDADQQGPFSTVEYSVLPGPNSDIFAFVTPLEGTLILRKPLDFETMPNFTVGLRAQDQGNPPKFTDTKLDVFVADADDQNPKFLDEAYTAIVPEGARRGAILRTLPRPIGAIDQDAGLRASLTYSLAPPAPPASSLFRVDPKTGALTLVADLKSGDLVQPVTLVLKATQEDNSDRYALATLIVSRAGYGPSSNGAIRAPLIFLQSELNIDISEDSPVGTRLIMLPTNRPGDPAVRYSLIEAGCRGLFAISPAGEVLLKASLDYEVATKHRCHILATDGRANATALLDVSVVNVNDWEPRFRRAHYEFAAPGLPGSKGTPTTSAGLLLGRLEAADGDRGDVLTLTLRGSYSSMFSLDPSGALFLRPGAIETLLGGNGKSNNDSSGGVLVHLVATATDSGVPPRSSSVPVTVRVGGAPGAGAIGRGAPTRGGTLADWGLVTAFTALLGLFAVVIAALSVYIYKVKKPKRMSRNRIHVNDTGGFLRSQQKPPQHTIGGLGMIGGALARSAGVSANGLGGSESTLSAGASTIIANSLERRAQADYTATVRSIMSRASQRNGMYECGEESPTPETSELSGTTSGVTRANEQGRATGLWVQGSGMPTRAKKLSWENGQEIKTDDDPIPHRNGTNLPENLTVYF